MSTNNGVKELHVGFPGDTSQKPSSPSLSGRSKTSHKGTLEQFSKKPQVLVPRFDISPYLRKQKKSFCIKKGLRKPPEWSVHSKRLNQECSVKLVNEDLVKLRREFLWRRATRSPSSDSDDPEMASIKCKFCEKMYSTEKKLQNHQTKKHMIVYKTDGKPQKRVSFSDHVIVHELKEYHKCRKCTKIFEDYKVLKTHMKQEHKKRKCYICHYCNKNFVDRTFFKVHIKLHCDKCGLLFPNKLTYNLHRRDVCRVLKLHNCKICDKSFFKFMDLKDHSYEHISTCYVCDICKDQFTTKCSIAHHISHLHSKKRPKSLFDMRNLGNERVYICNFCEESSVDRDILERHILLLPDLTNRRMTGYKDYYFCDQCLKKFSTEKDMLQHKWSHFLKTSDNSQERLKSILAKKSEKPPIKMRYKVGEAIPDFLKPSLVLEKIKIGGRVLEDTIETIDVNNYDIYNADIKKPIVDTKSKKTLLSKYQCQTCDKYYSSQSSLTRHIQTQHSDYENLKCKVCEETFVWPSLLQNHKCIRLHHPEMPFDDARPEVHFDNLHELTTSGFDDLNICDSEDYIHSVDFDIPTPIANRYDNLVNNDIGDKLQYLGYKVVMQEVPIEF